MIHLPWAWATALFMVSVSAPAAEGRATSQTLAEKLFQEAKLALAEGRAAEACPKLADSHELDPAGGTVLLLGLCLEQEGKLASAWSALHDALGYAARDGRPDRAERARQRLAAIEPRLPKLALDLPSGGKPSGFRLELDGTELPASAWETALPVDPGAHRVTVSAPGYSTRVVGFAAREAEATRLTVPALVHDDRSDATTTSSLLHRDLGMTSLVLGGAALVAGMIAGVTALRWDGAADQACPGTTCADAGAAAQSRQAENAAVTANWALAIGAALGVSGAILLWTAPDRGSTLSGAARVKGRSGDVTLSVGF